RHHLCLIEGVVAQGRRSRGRGHFPPGGRQEQDRRRRLPGIRRCAVRRRALQERGSLPRHGLAFGAREPRKAQRQGLRNHSNVPHAKEGLNMSNYEQLVIARDFRIRRTELTCPAHSLKMMSKAAGSEADEVILDLEDSCAVSQKVEARKTLIEALNTLDFKGKIRAFRPNNIRTKFFYKDVIEVVEAAGPNIDVM